MPNTSVLRRKACKSVLPNSIRGYRMAATEQISLAEHQYSAETNGQCTGGADGGFGGAVLRPANAFVAGFIDSRAITCAARPSFRAVPRGNIVPAAPASLSPTPLASMRPTHATG